MIKFRKGLFKREKDHMSSLRKKIISSLLLFSSTLISIGAFSQEMIVASKSLFNQVSDDGVLSIKHDQVNEILHNSQQTIVLALPLPNGKLTNFTLTPDSIMADGLARKYPNIRTFSGVSLDDPQFTGRFDITPNGFHGLFYYEGERIFIEPANSIAEHELAQKAAKTSRTLNVHPRDYISYTGKESRRESRLKNELSHKFHQPKLKARQVNFLSSTEVNRVGKAANALGPESAIKTYRIAISAAGEYTNVNGGTVDSAMAEIATLVNRLNQVYQHDLAIKLELVENNDLLIFTDANTDPFENDDDDGSLNTDVIDGIIGNENYDIGHVLNTNGGGLAVLQAVCQPWYKGDGVTGDSRPNNDAFYIDYVAHEVGHQFGANHTFNGTADACEGGRVSSSAYEVGSGSTIMAYAGICDDQNLQSHSDAFFHARSIDQISNYTQNGAGSSCGSITGNTNNTPVVDAGSNYTIPARTPFKLSGSATDSDGDELTYSWQQFDLGEKSASLAEQVDDGTRPLFRAFLPTNFPERYFPQLSDVLNNKTTIGESLPTTNRELNFRLMVFDGQGGVSSGETKLTVVDTGEDFSITSPLSSDTWISSSNEINWNVAGTTNEPINCSSIDVLLSQDNGQNFNITLASQVTNDGMHDLSIDTFCADEINTSQARVKLVCSDNIFFAINNAPFTIDKALSSADIAIIAQQDISLVQGDSIEITSELFSYACEAADSITIQSGENYSFNEGTITPNEDVVGELIVPIVANKDSVSSDTFMVTIIVDAKPEPEPEPEPEPTPTPPSSKSSGSMFWLLILFGATLFSRNNTWLQRQK